jgi:hypothetical protein
MDEFEKDRGSLNPFKMSKTRFNHLFEFLFCGLLSFVSILSFFAGLVDKEPIEGLMFWLLLGAAVMFPYMTVRSFIGFKRNLNENQLNQVDNKFWNGVGIAIIYIIGGGILIWIAFAFFGALEDAPIWAIIIIVLLILLLLKRSD